jgi:hypothetical protein
MHKTILALGLALVAGIPRAQAADECNGFINISYPGAAPVQKIGDVLTVKIDLGSGTITGGPLNTLTINSFGFDLSCADPPGPTPNCPSEGAVAAYNGDASLNAVCGGITFTSSNPGGGASPSHIIFTASSDIVIPHDTPIPPGFCSFSFQVTVLAPSANANGVIEQVISYNLAECDNGVLLSGGFQTGAIPVTPPDKFACYEVTKGGLKPKISVTVEDVFGTSTPLLDEIHRLCAPVVIPPDPVLPGIINGVHLLGYQFTGPPNTVLDTGVKIATQFGLFTADVKGPARLLVPSSKSLTPPAPPAPPNVGGVRHFMCHNLANLSGPNLSHASITYVDQFSALMKPPGPTTVPGFSRPSRWLLCAPANKNNEDPSAVTDPTGLLCLFAANTRPFGNFPFFANNQFGPNQFANKPQATQLDDFCVPATITP